MGDQVQFLNKEPKHFQIGEPDAPCGGCSTCTDCVVSQIVFHEKGRFVSAHDVRGVAAPSKIGSSRGLNAWEALAALQHYGVTGYQVHVNATADDAIRATDAGIVLVAVGYDGFPTVAECETGGKTDTHFTGPHAISLWGRRNWQKPQQGVPTVGFKPGWRVWTRDPDHHWGDKTPAYDRFRSSYLVRAMDAIIGNEGWQTRLILARPQTLWRPKLAVAVEPHLVEPLAETATDFPDFGSGQQG